MEDIDILITTPKKIIGSKSKELKIEGRHLKGDFELLSLDKKHFFRMFIRKSMEFPENFSIGLDYNPKTEKGFPLIRYNGPHYVTEDVIKTEPHYGYHIHKIKEEDIEKNVRKISFCAITDEFDSYEKALNSFIKKVNIINSSEYFSPELDFG